MDKLVRLQELLKSYGKAAVAYSGGVDSSFLLRVAIDTLGKENVLSITAVSSVTPKEELEESVKFINELDANHIFLKLNVFDIPGFKENQKDRCYTCKHGIFTEIIRKAAARGISVVMDGTNADDEGDYRPGMKALQELKVVSPLKQCGFTKAEIRALSKELKLDTWDKPSLACLASRVPYYDEITEEKLQMVDEAESYLRSLGFVQLRVRCHGKLARIELMPQDMRIVFDKNLSDEIYDKMKKIGFEYTALDLKGYRTGSLNEVLNK